MVALLQMLSRYQSSVWYQRSDYVRFEDQGSTVLQVFISSRVCIYIFMLCYVMLLCHVMLCNVM